MFCLWAALDFHLTLALHLNLTALELLEWPRLYFGGEGWR